MVSRGTFYRLPFAVVWTASPVVGVHRSVQEAISVVRGVDSSLTRDYAAPLVCRFLWVAARLMVMVSVDVTELSTGAIGRPDIRSLLSFHVPMNLFASASDAIRPNDAVIAHPANGRNRQRRSVRGHPRRTERTRQVRIFLTATLMIFMVTLAEVGPPFTSPVFASPQSAFAAAHSKAQPKPQPTPDPRAQSTWVSVVPAMEIIEAFDPPDKAWLKGHRGIDVLAVAGEPVRAPSAGVIRFRGSVAGTATISIATDSGHVVSFQPANSELKKGEEFAAGAKIGTVGDGSHCASSCLHIGVWLSSGKKKYIDPAKLFGHDKSILLPLSRKPTEESSGDSAAGGNTSSGAGAWGNHRNGRIPSAAMCPLRSAPGQMLRCDAQAAFDRLSHAYAARFTNPISVTDSYRDYDTQVILKRRKGRMAATPGTSNHGWALAVDLGGGINSFGSAQHQWMRANAPKFGWIHPGWAQQSGSLPEAWHWEFRK